MAESQSQAVEIEQYIKQAVAQQVGAAVSSIPGLVKEAVHAQQQTAPPVSSPPNTANATDECPPVLVAPTASFSHITHNLRTFGHPKKSVDVRNWIQDCEDLFAFSPQPWTERQKAFLAGLKLEGVAYEWWQSRRNNITSWAEFKDAITERFAPNKAQLQFQLQEAKQHKKESLEDYLSRFSLLLRQVHGDNHKWDEFTFHNFLRGVTSVAEAEKIIERNQTGLCEPLQAIQAVIDATKVSRMYEDLRSARAMTALEKLVEERQVDIPRSGEGVAHQEPRKVEPAAVPEKKAEPSVQDEISELSKSMAKLHLLVTEQLGRTNTRVPAGPANNYSPQQPRQQYQQRPHYQPQRTGGRAGQEQGYFVEEKVALPSGNGSSST